jgi:hypothetical protein
MTTCSFCLDKMAARSEYQLADRKVCMRTSPKIKLSKCPYCEGTEWATTNAMVEYEGTPGIDLGLRRWLIGVGISFVCVVLAFVVVRAFF